MNVIAQVPPFPYEKEPTHQTILSSSPWRWKASFYSLSRLRWLQFWCSHHLLCLSSALLYRPPQHVLEPGRIFSSSFFCCRIQHRSSLSHERGAGNHSWHGASGLFARTL